MQIQFGVGSVIGASFSMFFQNLPLFLGAALMVYVPTLILGIVTSMGLFATSEALSTAAIAVVGLTGLLFIILSFALAGAMAYGVLLLMRGEKATISGIMSLAFNRLGKIMGVSILSGILAGFGTLLCVIPGILFYTMYWVAVPVVMAERLSVFDSLGRSRALTKGHRMEIFGILFVFVLITFVLNFVVGFLAPADETASSIGPVLVGSVAQFLVQTTVGAISAIAASVGYYALRMDSEGIGLDELAQVFD